MVVAKPLGIKVNAGDPCREKRQCTLEGWEDMNPMAGEIRGLQNQREVRRTQNPGPLFLSGTLLGFGSQIYHKSLVIICGSIVRCWSL